MTGPLPLEPADLRLSDDEREQVAAFLRLAASEGRLTIVELEERLEATYGARVRGDLAGVTEGLPLPEVPAPVRPSGPPVRARANRVLMDHVRAYVLVNTLLVVIWAATGAGYFWPFWPILGWGFGLLAHWWWDD